MSYGDGHKETCCVKCGSKYGLRLSVCRSCNDMTKHIFFGEYTQCECGLKTPIQTFANMDRNEQREYLREQIRQHGEAINLLQSERDKIHSQIKLEQHTIQKLESTYAHLRGDVDLVCDLAAGRNRTTPIACLKLYCSACDKTGPFRKDSYIAYCEKCKTLYKMEKEECRCCLKQAYMLKHTKPKESKQCSECCMIYHRPPEQNQ